MSFEKTEPSIGKIEIEDDDYHGNNACVSSILTTTSKMLTDADEFVNLNLYRIGNKVHIQHDTGTVQTEGLVCRSREITITSPSTDTAFRIMTALREALYVEAHLNEDESGGWVELGNHEGNGRIFDIEEGEE